MDSQLLRQRIATIVTVEELDTAAVLTLPRGPRILAAFPLGLDRIVLAISLVVTDSHMRHILGHRPSRSRVSQTVTCTARGPCVDSTRHRRLEPRGVCGTRPSSSAQSDELPNLSEVRRNGVLKRRCDDRTLGLTTASASQTRELSCCYTILKLPDKIFEPP